jgi:glutaredoxin 3
VESSYAPRARCERHGLATGPDGRCTVCKRADPPEPPVIAPAPQVARAVRVGARPLSGAPLITPELQGGGARWLGWALGIFGLVLAAAFAAYMLAGDDALAMLEGDAVPVMAQGSAAPLVISPPQPSQPQAPQLQPSHQQPTASATPQRPEPAETSSNLQPQVQDPAAAQRTQQRTPEQIAEEAERDRKRSAMIEADIERRKLVHARGGVLVQMYSTSWCPACKAAREYMTSNEIPYVDNDVDESESARAILKRLNPRGSIPTIDVDGEVMIGFSAQRIDSMLERAAHKRAGI